MAGRKTVAAEREALAKRRVPCILTYLSPFRMVLTPDWQWDATLEQINGRAWDYVKLHEMAGGFDVGLPRHIISSSRETVPWRFLLSKVCVAIAKP